jgi:hypothetical protein
MSNIEESPETLRGRTGNRLFNRRLQVIVTVVVAAMVGAGVWVIVTSPPTNNSSTTTGTAPSQYTSGVVDASEPSGLAPPGATAIPGYTRSYVSDFSTGPLPSVWGSFDGVPGGDPTGQFSSAHVVVHDGLLELNAWKDPAFHNKWVTGGVCLCGEPLTYGAFFVRSRQTGSGPNEVELLWPRDNSWPPEIDFNESGGATYETSATVHWSALNHLLQNYLNVDLSKWHTWGVIWTPKMIKYTVDGRVWATDTDVGSIPSLPMTIDLEQRTVCDPLTQCPARPTSLLVDWVVTFSPKTT